MGLTRHTRPGAPAGGPASAAAGTDGHALAPAATGAYGIPPRGDRLPDAARLGPVHLQVADLDRSVAFYAGVLGLAVVEAAAAQVTLGAPAGAPAAGAPAAGGRPAGATPLVTLHARPGARPAAPRGRLGLYHTALLLPDRAALGRLVRHLAARGVRFGASDHLVSEALYLADPDGLGVEVYADRPRAAWRRLGCEVQIATEPLDVAGLVRVGGAEPWRGAPAGTRVGHVHLHVGDLGRAAAFYGDALGFDRMAWSYPGALFFGAGGYHHHLGANTWAGPGARPPAEDDARLLAWTVELPSPADAAAVAGRIGRGGHPIDDPPADAVVAARDPWGTAVRVRATGSPAPEDA